jgi:alpha-1,3-rhamnosyltransferase
MNYAISVLIPTYNPKATLEITLNSIIKQDFLDKEIIVIDDNSDAAHICYLKDLNRKFKFKLILLDTNSGGCARPLNIGIRSSNGKYISICAQDDFYLPQKLSKQYSLLEGRQDCAMIYSDCFVTYGDGVELSIEPRTPKRRQGYIFEDLLFQRFYIPSPTVMIRRDVALQLGGFDENLFIEDWDMWMRVAFYYPILYINEKLACYRIHEHSLSQSRRNDMKLERKKIIDKWNFYPQNDKADFIADFLDSSPLEKSLGKLLYQWLICSAHVKNPYRLFRILMGHVKNKYFQDVR